MPSSPVWRGIAPRICRACCRTSNDLQPSYRRGVLPVRGQRQQGRHARDPGALAGRRTTRPGDRPRRPGRAADEADRTHRLRPQHRPRRDRPRRGCRPRPSRRRRSRRCLGPARRRRRLRPGGGLARRRSGARRRHGQCHAALLRRLGAAPRALVPGRLLASDLGPPGRRDLRSGQVPRSLHAADRDPAVTAADRRALGLRRARHLSPARRARGPLPRRRRARAAKPPSTSPSTRRSPAPADGFTSFPRCRCTRRASISTSRRNSNGAGA